MRILGIGDNTVDMYIDRGVQFPGGNAVNVAVMAKKLGVDSSYLGCIGTDQQGSQIKQALIDEGVDISHIREIESLETSWSRIRHQENDRYFAGSHNGFAGLYHLNVRDYAFIGEHDIAHSSIYSRLEDDLPEIKAHCSCVSFDFSANWDHQYLHQVLPHIDLGFFSFEDADEDACNALCKSAQTISATDIVITRGLKPVIAYIGNEFHRHDVIASVPKDTLGAGDGFISGYLVAQLQKLTIPQRLAIASANAANICQILGAFGHGQPIPPEHRALKDIDRAD